MHGRPIGIKCALWELPGMCFYFRKRRLGAFTNALC